MKSIYTVVSIGAGAVFGFLFGSATPLFWTLVALACVDYVTGIIKAITTKTLDSRVGWTGIARKICMFALLIVAHRIDVAIDDSSVVLMSACEMFFVGNEGISVIENCAKIGVPIPQKLIDVLEQIKEK